MRVYGRILKSSANTSYSPGKRIGDISIDDVVTTHHEYVFQFEVHSKTNRARGFEVPPNYPSTAHVGVHEYCCFALGLFFFPQTAVWY